MKTNIEKTDDQEVTISVFEKMRDENPSVRVRIAQYPAGVVVSVEYQKPNGEKEIWSQKL